jgi:hypothetical protein
MCIKMGTLLEIASYTRKLKRHSKHESHISKSGLTRAKGRPSQVCPFMTNQKST